MGDHWHIRLWKPHESVDEVKWSMIMLKQFPCVCCFINKLFSITLSHLMLKTTLWSREVSRYTKEESDYLEVKVLSQSQETQVLSLDIYWVTPTTHHCLIPRDSRAGNLRRVSGSDCLPMNEPLLCGLCFLRGTVSSKWQRSWTSWKGEKESPLGSSGGIGRSLPFRVPPLLLLLALLWHWEQKKEG